MSGETEPVTIRILDKEYHVNCPERERASLLESAHHLDQQMRKIQGTQKFIGTERTAVMAALNITHALLQAKAKLADADVDYSGDIDRMIDRIDAAIHKSGDLGF